MTKLCFVEDRFKFVRIALIFIWRPLGPGIPLPVRFVRTKALLITRMLRLELIISYIKITFHF